MTEPLTQERIERARQKARERVWDAIGYSIRYGTSTAEDTVGAVNTALDLALELERAYGAWVEHPRVCEGLPCHHEGPTGKLLAIVERIEEEAK